MVSIDAETIFGKILNLSLIKTLSKLRLESNILIEIKASVRNQQLRRSEESDTTGIPIKVKN